MFHSWQRHDRVLVWLSAILAACAAGVKWTGLAFMACIFIFEVFRLYVEHSALPRISFLARIWKLAKVVSFYLVICIVFYSAIFALHFALLPRSGPGDAFMTPRFQMTLVGSIHAANTKLTPEGFWGKFIELNAEMYRANKNLPATADYASKWYTWPFMTRGIFYWQGTSQYIYLLGNPLVYWLGTVSIFMLAEYSLRLFLRKRFTKNVEPATPFESVSGSSSSDQSEAAVDSGSPSVESETGRASNWKPWALSVILIGFLVNYLPFIFIGRVMFLYHYEAALIFSVIAIGFILEMLPKGRWRLILALALILVTFMFYRYFSPLTYGTRLSDPALQARMWLPSWR
jgi:dolichyl-phosphate-mannose-protein mannosyltransferase